MQVRLVVFVKREVGESVGHEVRESSTSKYVQSSRKEVGSVSSSIMRSRNTQRGKREKWLEHFSMAGLGWAGTERRHATRIPCQQGSDSEG